VCDWQKGALALCVAPNGRWVAPGYPDVGGPRSGSVSHVAGLESCPEDGGLYLCFDEWPGEAFNARYFRKIDDHAPDEFDREVIEQMKSAPVGVPA